MAINIAQLEQAWLQAETLADVAKREAIHASSELQVRNTKVVDATEVKILMTTVEQAKVRQADAERKASAAFDLLWQAKGQHFEGQHFEGQHFESQHFESQHSKGQGQQSVHA